MQGVRGVQGILGIPDPINEPMFSTAERDRRWARLRELMDADGVDLLIVLPAWLDPDAMYVADNAGVTIFPLTGDPILILGGESSTDALEVPQWIDDRLSVTALGSTAADFGRATAEVLRARGLTGLRTAIAGLRGGRFSSVRQPEGYAGYTTVKRIAEAVGPDLVVDGTDIVGRARYVKGDEEIRRLTASVRIGEASLEAMAATAGAGVPQLEVYGQMLLAQVRAGADKLHAAWCPGTWGAPRHRYVSPPPGVLHPGLYVSTELMPEVRGYQAQVAQPMVIGEPSAQALEVFAANSAAFDAGLGALKPGRRWGDVFAAVEEAVAGTAGTMFTLLHGRGLGNDGPLVIPTAASNARADVADDVILENTTFILKPFLEVRESPASFARTHDVTWGDTIVVTTTGARRLGTRARELTVIEA
jgi:Xaa-Pro aminopeptidase